MCIRDRTYCEVIPVLCFCLKLVTRNLVRNERVLLLFLLGELEDRPAQGCLIVIDTLSLMLV